MGAKSANTSYRNEMIIGNENRRTYGSKDIYYFSQKSKNDQLIKLDTENFARQYLYDCPKARKELEKFKANEGNKAHKILGGLGFAYTIIALPGVLTSLKQGRQDDKNRAIFTVGIGAVSTYLLFKNTKYSGSPKPDEMIEIINLYNNCTD